MPFVKYQAEEMQSGRWVISFEMSFPVSRCVEEVWLGTFDEVHAKLRDTYLAMLPREKKAPPPDLVPEAAPEVPQVAAEPVDEASAPDTAEAPETETGDATAPKRRGRPPKQV